MHRRILAPVAAAALAFGLVACGDTGGGTVTTPPPSINIGGGSDDGGAEPSDGGGEASDGGGDSTVAAPDIPAPDPADYPGMDQNTPEGAEQAFKYYIAMMTWGYQTGEYSQFSELHSDSCETCLLNEENIREFAKVKRYWGPTTIEPLGAITEDSPNYDIEVGYIFSLSEHTEPSSNDNGNDVEPEKEYSAIAGMNWVNDRWIVDSMDFEVGGGEE